VRKGDAEVFETDIKRRRQLGDMAGSQWSRRTVSELAEDWFDLYVIPNLAKRTRRDYQVLLDRHIIPRLGKLKLRDVSTDVVDRFKRDLERQGTGRSQTRQTLAVLQGMFRYAEERGRVIRNPVRLVRKPSNKRERAVVVLAPETVELVREELLAADRLGDATLVSVLVTGPAAPGGVGPRMASGAREDRGGRPEERGRGADAGPEDRKAGADAGAHRAPAQ